MNVISKKALITFSVLLLASNAYGMSGYTNLKSSAGAGLRRSSGYLKDQAQRIKIGFVSALDTLSEQVDADLIYRDDDLARAEQSALDAASGVNPLGVHEAPINVDPAVVDVIAHANVSEAREAARESVQGVVQEALLNNSGHVGVEGLDVAAPAALAAQEAVQQVIEQAVADVVSDPADQSAVAQAVVHRLQDDVAQAGAAVLVDAAQDNAHDILRQAGNYTPPVDVPEATFWERTSQTVKTNYNAGKILIKNNPKMSALIAASTLLATGAVAYKLNSKFRNKVNTTATRAKHKAQASVQHAKSRWNTLRNQPITKSDLLCAAGVTAAGLGVHKLYTVAKNHDMHNRVKSGYASACVYTTGAWDTIIEHKKATAALISGALIAGISYALYNNSIKKITDTGLPKNHYQEFKDSINSIQFESLRALIENDPVIGILLESDDEHAAIELAGHEMFMALLNDSQKNKIAYIASLHEVNA